MTKNDLLERGPKNSGIGSNAMPERKRSFFIEAVPNDHTKSSLRYLMPDSFIHRPQRDKINKLNCLQRRESERHPSNRHHPSRLVPPNTQDFWKAKLASFRNIGTHEKCIRDKKPQNDLALETGSNQCPKYDELNNEQNLGER